MSTTQYKDLHFNVISETTRAKICRKLDIKNAVGGDFRHLAALFDMLSENIELISQRYQEPTKEILQRWGAKREATVQNMLNVLQKMEREDVMDILTGDPNVQQALGK